MSLSLRAIALALAATAFVAMDTPDSGHSAGAEAPAPTAPSAMFNGSADALQPAVRTTGPAVVPVATVAAELAEATRSNTVRFNTCTANLLRDDRGVVLGVVGASHCVLSSNNVMSGVRSANIARSAISLDPETDVFTVGLDGHRAAEVHDQLERNYQRADVSARRSDVTAAMTGYPTFSNPKGEPVTLQLMLGGIVRWPNSPDDTIATFGNWNDRNQGCTPGASGAGLYVHLDGYGYVIIGVLSSRAEFERVQTMPYPAAYGLELREYFEQQLGRKVQADFLCGFAPPTT